MLRNRVVASVLSIAVLSAPGVAGAAPKKKAAKTQPAKADAPVDPDHESPQAHYASGLELYKNGEYRDAVVELELAAADIKKPALNLALARSLDKLGRNREALGHYREFVASAPASDSGQPEAKQRIEALAPIVAEDDRRAEAKRQADVEERAREAAHARVEQPPGVAHLDEKSPPPQRGPAGKPETGFPKRYIGPTVIAGIAVAAAGIGIGIVAAAKVKHDGCADLQSAGTYCQDDYLINSKNLQAGGYAAIGIGSAFAVYDVVLWVLATKKDASHAMRPVLPTNGALVSF